ncbi:MAG: FkbM family methyltransferase [Flavobacteriales bacterium]|nr:FkbM family methyltransferase [Flavobacteriales bacterium]
MKALLRNLIRWFVRTFPVRGRHRLADTLGGWAAEPVTVREINGICVELDRAVQYHRMMLYDLYEEDVLAYLRKRLKPGMVVFDPGCNIGYFAAQVLGMVSPGGQVWSFEPSPRCLERLHRHNPPNAIPGWRLMPMALTDRTGALTFYDTPRVITRGYAVLEQAGKPSDSNPVEVPVTSVDAFCADHGIQHIDFLKLDIEDSELPALRGARRMIAAKAIDTILVETEVRPDREELNRDIFNLLLEAGYRPFHARRGGKLVTIVTEHLPPSKEDIIWERPK